jgi:HD-like signal output (HDOD) protein
MQQALKVAADILARQHTPSIPLELLELKVELNKKYPNTVTVAQLISHNPELLANFLNLANTNLTQEKNPIQDAKVAVNLLGLQEIYNLFLSSVLSHILAEDDYERSILLHGAKAGLAAAELSYWVFDVSRTEAYIAGLMQNVGAIYLYRQHPDSYPDMFAGELSNPVSGYQKELERYQTSHVHIGGLLGKKWQINPLIYKALLFHHDLDFGLKTIGNSQIKHLTALTILSNYVVSVCEDEHFITQELKDYRDSAKQVLELPDNAYSSAMAAVTKWGNSNGLVSASH